MNINSIPVNKSKNMDAIDKDLLDEAAELEALGISVVDQQSLEKNVETEVDNAMVKHRRKQKLNNLKRELKQMQIKIRNEKIKLSNLESRIEGTKGRFVDPRKIIGLEKDITETNKELDKFLQQEMVIKDRIEIGENNEEELDDIADFELEEGELVEEHHATSKSHKGLSLESEEEKKRKENLVTSGEMTPFGTIINTSEKNLQPRQSSSGLSSFEQYLKDQLDKQKSTSSVKKVPKKEDSSLSKDSVFYRPPKKMKEFKGNTTRKSKEKKPLNMKILHPKKRIRSNVGSVTSMDDSDKMKKPSRPLSENVALESPIDSDYNESDSDYKPSDDEIQGFESSRLSRSPTKNTKKNNSKTKKKVEEKYHDDGSQESYLSRVEKWMEQKTRLKHEKIIKDEYDSEEENSYEEFGGGYKIPSSVWNKLFKYQKTCVRWLWELHGQACGGIIGDEMGLGKTIQIISFLIGLSYSRLYSSNKEWKGLGPVLIVTPATVLHQWVKEFHKWWPPFRVAVLHDSGSYTGTPRSLIYNMNRNNGVLMISYTGLRSNLKTLLELSWHYLILDEGHKIRNPEAQITVAVKRFPTPHRIILSGSPIQNSLKELWSLFDFIFPGKLGTLPVFLSEFAVPITQGGYSHANKIEVQTAFKCACILRDTINPYLLRRMKSDVKEHLNLPTKNEQVLFCDLCDEQKMAYKDYISGREVQTIMSGRLKVFVGLINLRKICNHPDLFTGGPRIDGTDLPPELKYGWAGRSGKMKVLESILRLWHKQKHKVLLFTQSKQMLLILERFVLSEKYEYLKMDGTTAVGSRQSLIEKYNNSPSIFIFLLTTRVGGLGINLTGADRIVIFDPDWNPSTDTQARERAWRIGQLRHVTIYRLLTAGTIEEKIYHRQIFKQFVTNKVLKDPKQQRFFKSNDLYELFTFKEGLKEKTESTSLFAGLDSEIKVKDIENKNKEPRSKVKLCVPDNVLNKRKRKQSTENFLIKNEKHCDYENLNNHNNTANNNENLDNLANITDINENLDNPPNITDIVNLDNPTNTTDNNENFDNPTNTTDDNENLDNPTYKNKLNNHTTDKNKLNNLNKPDSDNTMKVEKELIDTTSNTLINEPEVITDSKRDKMMEFAKMLSKKLSSDTTDNKSKKNKKKKKKDKHKKGAKFEGERIEFLVKKRSFKDEEKEETDLMIKNENQDQYVLEKLFKSSGVHSALSHDKIVNADDTDYLLLETEADKVAKEAIKKVRESRLRCFNPALREPKKKVIFGSSNKSTTNKKRKLDEPFKAEYLDIEDNTKTKSRNKAKIINSSEGNNIGGESSQLMAGEGSSGVMSSTQLIAKMKERNRSGVCSDSEEENADYPSLAPEREPIDPDLEPHLDLLTDIRNFIAFQARVDGQASTQEILDKFKARLPANISHIFKALLNEICDFRRDSDKEGYWYIKPEFR